MAPSAVIEDLVKQSLRPSTVSDDAHALTIQVLHNLRHQHDWTDLEIHYTPSSPTSDNAEALREPLTRPMISGLPPRRVYMHPDEQLEIIKAGIKDEDVPAEREWVLPSHLHEKWSLRRFGEAFDSISNVPPPADGEPAPAPGKWRQTKRLLLSTLDHDSTVVYYIVQDGIVKPRQN